MLKVIGTDTEVRPCVATIGTFDGVHRGHLFVVSQMIRLARERDLDAVVVTFPNHPLQVIRKDFQPQLLTLADEKIQLLQQAQVEKIALLEFSRELAEMSAYDFMRIVLKNQLQVKVLMIGYDNHFGHDCKSFSDYQQYGSELGIEVIQAPVLPVPVLPSLVAEGKTSFSSNKKDILSPYVKKHISSTTIRQALLSGDVLTANSQLGYHYFMQGTVVEGFQNGRKIGYPTANLQVDACKLVPENGVYLVKSSQGYGMLNIGTRPTLHNGHKRSVEVHLFDFEGDLYRQSMQVEFLAHLRKEQEFSSLQMLRHQLQEDERTCREIINQLKSEELT